MFWWYLLLIGLYVFVLIRLAFDWKQWRVRQSAEVTMAVSVVVPFRNEENHLQSLVNSLNKQLYKHMEVVFVNDHSTDSSLNVLNEALSDVSFDYKIIDLVNDSGKKMAIALGIKESRGEVILTTDADCAFGKDWVAGMASSFSSSDVHFVSGPVALVAKSLFQQWQQMEFSVLIGIGASGIKMGKPSMANGANLAYRKTTFESVGGFKGIDDIASGDDELLLMKIHDEFSGGIRFLKNSEVLVQTDAMSTWADFRNQRLRWAGKWRYGKRVGAIIPALMVFIFSLSILLLPALGAADIIAWWQVGAFLFARFVAELMLILSLSDFFKYKLSPIALLLHQILYPFYAIYFGVAANFGKYHWKGRNYRTHVQ